MIFFQKSLEDPVRLARLKYWFYMGLAAAALAEIIVPIVFQADHPHFSFERFPAWGSLYGLVSCLAIVVVSKLIGKVWLTRREDYYDS